MKVLLINPPYWTGGKTPLGLLRVTCIPLGLGYLASALESRGIVSKILDMDKANTSREGLKAKIADFDPEVVGITSFTSNYANAVKVAKIVKSCKPEAVVVMGGVHATFAYREILKTVPEVDLVIRYEGEYSLCDAIDALEKGKSLCDVKGIAYRDKDRIISTELRPKIEDLDEIPRPAFNLFDPPIEDYLGEGEERALPMITTRGCPFECIFCSTAALHGHKYRTRNTSKVVDEIEFLHEKYRINRIAFVDDNFTMQKSRIFELCNEIEKRNLNLRWGCSTRVDLLSEELLMAMKSSGCDDIFFGLESASQEVLDTIKKGFSIDKAKDVIKAVEKMGIKTHCSFILGLPGETAQSLRKMVKFVEEVKPSGRVLPNILDVLPGTELWDRRSEYSMGTPLNHADITSTQIELFFTFYQSNLNTNELLRIKPPKIMVHKGH